MALILKIIGWWFLISFSVMTAFILACAIVRALDSGDLAKNLGERNKELREENKKLRFKK